MRETEVRSEASKGGSSDLWMTWYLIYSENIRPQDIDSLLLKTHEVKSDNLLIHSEE